MVYTPRSRKAALSEESRATAIVVPRVVGCRALHVRCCAPCRSARAEPERQTAPGSRAHLCARVGACAESRRPPASAARGSRYLALSDRALRALAHRSGVAGAGLGRTGTAAVGAPRRAAD